MVTAPKENVRTLRRQENKLYQEYIIKMGLETSSIKNGTRNIFLNEIYKRVEQTSKSIHRLSLAFNLFIKQELNRHNEFYFISLPRFLSEGDTTPALQMMYDLNGARIPEPFVVSFLQAKRHLLPPMPYRSQGDTNTLVQATNTFLTCWKTFLRENLNGNQVKFFRLWGPKHGFDTSNQWKLRFYVNGWDTKEDTVWTNKNSLPLFY